MHVVWVRGDSHGVERRDLVHPHRGHLEHLCDVVHDRDAGPPLVLLLRDLEQGNDGGLLVLGRVLCDDGLGDFLVLCRELERDLGVVVRRVAVLRAVSTFDQCLGHIAQPRTRGRCECDPL